MNLKQEIVNLLLQFDHHADYNPGKNPDIRDLADQIDTLYRNRILELVPKEPVYPDVVDYVKMLKRAAEGGKYDEMFDNGWRAAIDKFIDNIKGAE